MQMLDSLLTLSDSDLLLKVFHLFSLVYFPGCHYHGNVVINASCNALIGQFLVERVQLPMEGGKATHLHQG